MCICTCVHYILFNFKILDSILELKAKNKSITRHTGNDNNILYCSRL